MPDKGAKILKFLEEVKLALEKAQVNESSNQGLFRNNLPLDTTGIRTKLYNHVRPSVHLPVPHDDIEESPTTNESTSGMQVESDESLASGITAIQLNNDETVCSANPTTQMENDESLPPGNSIIQGENDEPLSSGDSGTRMENDEAVSFGNPGIETENDESSCPEISEMVDAIDLARNEQNEPSTSLDIDTVNNATQIDSAVYYTREILDQVGANSGRHRFKPNELHSKRPACGNKKSSFRWDEALQWSTTAPAQRITIHESVNLMTEHNKIMVSKIKMHTPNLTLMKEQ